MVNSLLYNGAKSFVRLTSRALRLCLLLRAGPVVTDSNIKQGIEVFGMIQFSQHSNLVCFAASEIGKVSVLTIERHSANVITLKEEF